MQTDNEKAALAAAKSGRTLPRTQLGALRDLLLTIEKRIVKLKEISSEEALEILLLFDQAANRLTTLENAGGSTSSERPHFESLLLQFQKRRPLFVRRVGGAVALREARQTHQPDEGHWWWYTDEALARQRKSLLLRWAGGILILAIVLAGIAFVYQRFLAPDPALQASYSLQQDAEYALITGDPQLALEKVNEALTYTPDDAELYLLRGVVFHALDDLDAADEEFEIARQKYEDDAFFFAKRAGLYVLIGLPDLAIEDANTVIAIDPDLAYAYLYRGQAYETLGDSTAALADYELASEIAERTGNAEITVIARMRIANILQQAIPLDTETP
jgi:tetratricopeptide (TPR) repeat protein